MGGKKIRKTRWRALTLDADHQSDSEESQISRSYRFAYSSQSTPIRKFQNDSNKSTRSNSTTSEHKTTFNEDEYTRITTPRQDVLFKKGYLNKPKTFQTQTSTGTSSTGNSTSTCTPDHQSADGTEGTDLEYESQFVFPNGFIDQNGIYYINSFEPFPLVVYNAPMCYPEYANTRSKRYSTDSMTESLSPQNEEASQEMAQNCTEITNNVPVFNQIEETPSEVVDEPKKIKKKKRRKSTAGNDEEEEEDVDEDEVFDEESEKKSSLKPDAEEFVPRSFRPPEAYPVPLMNIPNFIPIPYDMPPPFLPPGVPLNLIPAANFVNVLPNVPAHSEGHQAVEEERQAQLQQPPPAPSSGDEETANNAKAAAAHKKDIDIAVIVSKLEEAVREQRRNETCVASPRLRRKPYQEQRARPRNYTNTGFPAKPLKDTARHPVVVVARGQIDADVQSTAVSYSDKLKTPKTEAPPAKATRPNQWISVARKRRKNKPAEEGTEEVAEETVAASPIPVEEASQGGPPVVAAQAPERNVHKTESGVDAVVVVVQAPVEETKRKVTRKAPRTNVKKVIVVDAFEPIVEACVQPAEEVAVVEVTVQKIQEAPVAVKEPETVLAADDAATTPAPDKKNKRKKKKKPTQSAANNDETYDFLIEAALLDNPDEKTNLEISEELDRMIQKGMYSSLEEKIRTIQPQLDDGFFEKVKLGIGKLETDGNFGMLLKSFNSVAIRPPINADLKMDVQPQGVSSTTAAATAAGGIFLENPIVNELIKSATGGKVETSVTLPVRAQAQARRVARDEVHEMEAPDAHALYPITRAVKDWMDRTRESTPDASILKSPNTIYKELIESGPPHDEDDVTVWSVSPPRSVDGDLLDCWENEQVTNGYHKSDVTVEVEQAEEVIEVYESKYGRNEDFIKLQEEVEEKRKTMKLPKHGDLPYRAICCSIM